jgi:histidine triad (HIT) family protein
MKKSLALIFVLTALIWAGFQISPQKFFYQQNCPFCNRSIVESQSIARENGAIALLNYKPAIAGHVLIIPERHVERFEDLTADELVQIHAMIAKVDQAERKMFGSTGYFLIQKNGIEAGQSVPHVHFHYFPMSQWSSKIWVAIRMFIGSWLKPLGPEELEQQRLEFERHGLAY